MRLVRPVGPMRGLGLFSGKPASINIAPAPIGNGFTFSHAIEPSLAFGASVANVTYDTTWAGLPKGVPVRNTTIGQPGSQRVAATIEHLLAALAGLGVWDALISIDGPEVPILDGSAAPLVELLQPALTPTPASHTQPLVLRSEVEVRDGDAAITAAPSTELSYTYQLDYGPNSPIKPHIATWRGSPTDFATTIAPARTFSLKAEAQLAQQAGLFKHLTPRQMLVIDDNGKPIENAWRMEHEPARHKLLDLIGDLALLGRPLLANVTATRSGHKLTHELCRQIEGATSRREAAQQ